MKYQIMDGTVSLGGKTVLSHIDFEIQGTERIALVGKNGAGKTTLLRLLAGEIELDRDDKRRGPGVSVSRFFRVGMLRQQALAGEERTARQVLMDACPEAGAFDPERYAFEREAGLLFRRLGFSEADMEKPVPAFSGGEQTKLALIRLLLEGPDLLLLDEPTNHLDLGAVQWLERYLRDYAGAVVLVSHDRFFLDRTAQLVYELEGGRLTRYHGNYTEYREEKKKRAAIQAKAYERQQEEIRRQERLIERFKHKPSKAAFARSRRKMLERMERVEKPEEDHTCMAVGPIEPEVLGGKWVLQAEHLKIGYRTPLLELSLRIRRGQKIGILGDNGAGKTTFLKTAAGFLAPLEGRCVLGGHITIGYFDQLSAGIQSELTAAEHFSALFPGLTQKEVRTILGRYLFGGREAAKRVNDLSGGERARLVLAELLTSRPNFLILDEPTNHMDIQAKEVLEEAFSAYTGTILFVSHDRYFISRVAQSLLMFENGAAMYYPFGYQHYLERRERELTLGESPAARIKAEEQALVAGLRAVPRGERGCLREISTEAAYEDWRLRLAGEPMEEAARRVEALEDLAREEEARELLRWTQEVLGEPEASEERESFGGQEAKMAGPPGLCSGDHAEALREAWDAWHEACLAWYEVWCGEEQESG